MGHDAHFLSRLDRVTPAQTDLALGLYRHHSLVRRLLRDPSLPPGAERVALALEDDAGLGPHVVVSRSGTFVTCLARGMMPFGLPILSRQRIDQAIAKDADMRERLAAWNIGRPPTVFGYFEPILTKQNLLAREEARGLALFAPFFAPEMFCHHGPALVRVLSIVTDGRRSGRARARADWKGHARDLWFLTHAFEAAGMVGEAIRPIVEDEAFGQPFVGPCVMLMDWPILARGVWAASRIGGLAIEVGIGPEEARHPAADAATIAARMLFGLTHPEHHAETERLFVKLEQRGETADAPKDVRTIGELCSLSLSVLRDPEAARAAALDRGRAMHFELTRSRLPPGDPDRPARPEDCPDDLAATALSITHRKIVGETADTADMLQDLSVLARADEGIFHYPRRLVPKLLQPWGPSDVDAHVEKLLDGIEPTPPERAPTRPGRNDTCPCGSTKKWKKCCGR